MQKPGLLIVDDEPLLLNALQRDLRALATRYTLYCAQSGQQALHILADNPIRIMITDILMPDIEGLELIRRVKEQFPAIHIVAMSGGGERGMLDFLQMAKLFGARAVLKKPFDRQALLAAIDGIPDDR